MKSSFHLFKSTTYSKTDFSKERDSFFQLIGIIAITMIFVDHFVSTYVYYPSFLLSHPSTSWFFRIFSSGMGISILCVVSGYFAYLVPTENKYIINTVLSYSIKRYFKMVIPLFLAHIAIFFIINIGEKSGLSIFNLSQFGLRTVIASTILFRDNLIPTLWPLKDLVIAPMLIVLIKSLFKDNLRQNLIFTGIFLICMLNNQFVFAAILTGIPFFYLYKRSESFKSYLIFISLLLSILIINIPFFDKSKINTVTYSLTSIAIILLLWRIRSLKLFANKIIISIGNASYEMYLWHMILINSVALIPGMRLVGFIQIPILFLWFLALCLLSYLLHHFSQLFFLPANEIIKKTAKLLKDKSDLIKGFFTGKSIIGYNPLVFIIILTIFSYCLWLYVYSCSLLKPGIINTPGFYNTDYYIHTLFANNLFNDLDISINFTQEDYLGLSIVFTYPLFHLITKLISFLPLMSIEASSGLTIVLFILFTILLTRHLMYNAIPKISYKQMYLIDFISIASIFVLTMYIPFISEAIYLPSGNPNVWHNPTTIIARPFAILTVLFFIKSFKNRNGNYKKYLLIFAVFLLLGALAKPSYSIVFLPVAAIYILYSFISSKGKTFIFSLLNLLAVLPTIALNLLQLSFSMQRSSSLLDAFTPRFGLEETIRYLLLMSIFPLFVLFQKGYRMLKDPLYNMIWLAFVSGALWYFLTNDSDYIWGYVIAAYMLVGYSAYLFFLCNETAENKITNGIGTGIFIIKLGIGVVYFITGVLGSHLFY